MLLNRSRRLPNTPYSAIVPFPRAGLVTFRPGRQYRSSLTPPSTTHSWQIQQSTYSMSTCFPFNYFLFRWKTSARFTWISRGASMRINIRLSLTPNTVNFTSSQIETFWPTPLVSNCMIIPFLGINLLDHPFPGYLPDPAILARFKSNQCFKFLFENTIL